MKEALKLALEALKTIDEAMPFPVAKLAIKECKAALEAPQRTWVGLTDDELLFLHGYDSELYDLIKVVETKLKEKNNG